MSWCSKIQTSKQYSIHSTMIANVNATWHHAWLNSGKGKGNCVVYLSRRKYAEKSQGNGSIYQCAPPTSAKKRNAANRIMEPNERSLSPKAPTGKSQISVLFWVASKDIWPIVCKLPSLWEINQGPNFGWEEGTVLLSCGRRELFLRNLNIQSKYVRTSEHRFPDGCAR